MLLECGLSVILYVCTGICVCVDTQEVDIGFVMQLLLLLNLEVGRFPLKVGITDTYCCPCVFSRLNMDVADLNMGLHAHVGSPLPINPSPQRQPCLLSPVSGPLSRCVFKAAFQRWTRWGNCLSTSFL